MTQQARLNDILCHREQRLVSDQLTLSYDRKQIILERNNISEALVRRLASWEPLYALGIN